ncbi:hypothetical protein [Streptomyces sp. NPDC056682]|uniref:hypothetical protein n=1 Tax=Streptomyces sp. NPDC056682 TaxID=3345909 RepID=UPI0036B43A4C
MAVFRSPNEKRVTAHAEAHGWTVRSRDDLSGTVVYQKRGSGYLRVAFGMNGHVLRAATAKRPLRGTQAVLDYLEKT